jgi:hypothetical protein
MLPEEWSTVWSDDLQLPEIPTQEPWDHSGVYSVKQNAHLPITVSNKEKYKFLIVDRYGHKDMLAIPKEYVRISRLNISEEKITTIWKNLKPRPNLYQSKALDLIWKITHGVLLKIAELL